MRVTVYDHADAFLFELAEADVFECKRTEEINGEHSLSITTTRRLQQSQRVLTQDATGKWREYVVVGADEVHNSGNAAIGTYYCVWSVQHDLSTVYGPERRPGVDSPVTCAVALEAALDGTNRWQVGSCYVSGSGGVSMYNNSAWERIADVITVFGGELDARITVNGTKVTGREVMLYDLMGSAKITRRFDWGRDTTGIRRIPPEGARVCRVKFLGKGEETDDGYGRKITIADANGGIDYLRDTSAEAAFKLPNGSGGWEYPMTIVENSDIDTPQKLKAWGQKVLHDYTRPTPRYEASVLQYAEAGADMKGVSLGDPVHIVDRGFNPDAALRLEARVVKVVTNEFDPSDVQVTVGAVGAMLSDYFKSLDAKMKAVQTQLDAMWHQSGGTDPTTAQYITWLMNEMSNRINESGGYIYEVPGYGLRTYDKAVSDPSVGAEATKVVALTGGGIMFANSRKANGDWDWKTLIESGHIATELITGGRIITGFIGNMSGNYWNLETGQIRLLANTSVGDTTMQQVIANAQNGANAYGDVSNLKVGSASSVDIVYGVSSSANAKPTSMDTDANKIWRKGKFLWVREKVTMYDGKVKYSEWRLLANGSGIGVKKVTEQYYMSTSRTVLRGGSWASKQQSYKDGCYYFTRSRIEWSDGTVTYDPSVDGKLADTFTSVTDVYDSALNHEKVFKKLTKGGTVQGLSTDRHGNLYVNATYIQTGTLSDQAGRNKWNLETGEFQLSSVAALEEKVDSTRIGGENVINGTADWTGWAKKGNFAVSGDVASSAARSSITDANQWSNSIASPSYVTYGRVKNKELTVSFDMKTTAAWGTVAAKNSVTAELKLCNGDNSRQRWRYFQISQQPTTSWKRVSFTVLANNSLFTGGSASFSDSLRLGVGVTNRSNKQLSIRRVKVEVGNVATDWSASSRDADLAATAKANAAKKRAYDDAKTYTDGISEQDRKYTDDQKKDLDRSFDAAKVFNRLTKNGLAQGIYSQGVDASGRAIEKRGGKYVTTPHHYDYYFNATYVKTGTLDAKVIKAGIIAPAASTQGSFKINMATGYIMSRNMEADNIKVNGGSVSVDANGIGLKLASGRITGYRGSSAVGYIDPSARVRMYKDGVYQKTVDGLQIQSKGILRISAPYIGVLNSSDTSKTTVTAYTGWVKVDDICLGGRKQTVKGADEGHWYNYEFYVPKKTGGKLHLRFINGLLVEVSTQK